MTKAAICTHCWDIVAPRREWRTDRSWRWCECDHMGIRWRDGAAGLVEVTAMHGPAHLRVLGLNNGFVATAIQAPPGDAEGWRDLHAASCETVGPGYLFHVGRRACWALLVRPGESGDVIFTDYAVAKGFVAEEPP